VYQFPYHRKGVFKKDQKIIFLNKGGGSWGLFAYERNCSYH